MISKLQASDDAILAGISKEKSNNVIEDLPVTQKN